MFSTDPSVPTDVAETKMIGSPFKNVHIFCFRNFYETLSILLFDDSCCHARG